MDNCIATIGFFDGVHLGHRFVLEQLTNEAKQRNLRSVVVALQAERPRLTSPDDKRRLILEAGIDRCEILPFTPELMGLSAFNFMNSELRDKLGVKVLMLGYDNRFGKVTPHEGFDDYVAYGRDLGIEVLRMPEFRLNPSSLIPHPSSFSPVPHSSTIRKALLQGDINTATTLLGRRYTITAKVVHGYGEGQRMGFPTANLSPVDSWQIVPANGVYEVEVELPTPVTPHHLSPTIHHPNLPGMMNIGTRPTFHGNNKSLEVNIIGFNGNLYGETVTVTFIRWMRDERSFESTEALRQQLESDRQNILDSHTSHI